MARSEIPGRDRDSRAIACSEDLFSLLKAVDMLAHDPDWMTATRGQAVKRETSISSAASRLRAAAALMGAPSSNS